MSNAITKHGGGFTLSPSNMQEAMQAAEMLAGSQMVPKSYQGRPQDTLVAMMMGNELGLNPIQSLQNIAVINGKPSIYGDAVLALVQNHPTFGGHEETFDEQSMTATCTVWRKGDAHKHSVTFSQQDAVQANLWGKQGPWKQYPKRMLMWRARGYALRDKFADALGGLITIEEAQDMPTAAQDVPRDPEPQELPAYPADKFEANMPKWREAIESGKFSADDIITKVQTRGTLDDAQQQAIRDCAQSDDNVIDGEATEVDQENSHEAA